MVINEKQRKTELADEKQRKFPDRQLFSSKAIKVRLLIEHYIKIGISVNIDGP